ncbi:histone deacetylase complex subunit [Salvia divinorum]|uniref:Histone deacetylase complex subunit n=1 Tax=Salvia divinorum TaxID=28513 RepID=A0ABD1FLL2_SALDI
MESSPSPVLSPFREECRDEELPLFPRHTKVIVTGNNRTKKDLVGLQGVVKKAVRVGGWHWLVLKNGAEVKLQRNALSVLEPPTGNEEDNEYDFDDSSSGSDMGEESHRRFSDGLQLRDRELIWQSFVCSESLWRYCQSFHLANNSSQPTKEQLIKAVQHHILSQKVDEIQVIVEFISAAKRLQSVGQY